MLTDATINLLKRKNMMVAWTTLTLPEILSATNVGILRHYESFKDGRKQDFTLDPNTNILFTDIEGALGELCVAKVRDRYFSATLNNFKDADLGKDVQVRTTSRHDFKLIVRSNDNPNHFYFLVTGMSPTFCVRGWMKGSDAMQDKYLKAPNGRPPAWFVPPTDLNPVTTKVRKIHDNAPA
jgi:hypothetical protein